MNLFWFRCLVVWLFLGAGLRCWLLLFYPEGAQHPGAVAFFLGSLNDVLAFALVWGVVAVLGSLSLILYRSVVVVFVAVFLLVFIAEVFFWHEFEGRLDRLVFHYLAYPKEVLVFLEEQFFLSLLLLPFVLVCWMLIKLLGGFPKERVSLPHAVVAGVLCVATVSLGGPLGQSNTRVASEFVSNGYLGVLSAALYSEDQIPWLEAVSGESQPGDLPTATQPFVDDRIQQEVSAKRHVVLIIEESFAGPVWRDPQLSRKFLPNFLALEQESVSFKNLFATGSRTTRGMEALLNGYPPLPGISTTQREGYQRLPSLARALNANGFHSGFLYGGWPEFSDFTRYWKSSDFVETWSREDFDAPFETSWGVADDALMNRMIVELNTLTEKHDRVFLASLTVSHHRPYDYPTGVIEFPEDQRRSEYAMAFADHALGQFFEAAKKAPWYADTLFIVVADHGLHPKGDTLIPADSYRIPMLLHGAGVRPRTVHGYGSSMSLAATLMATFELETREGFYGSNLLCDCDTVVPLEYGYHAGLLERDRLLVMTRDGMPLIWGLSEDSGKPSSQSVQELERDPGWRKLKAVFGRAYQDFYSG